MEAEGSSLQERNTITNLDGPETIEQKYEFVSF